MDETMQDSMLKGPTQPYLEVFCMRCPGYPWVSFLLAYRDIYVGYRLM